MFRESKKKLMFLVSLVILSMVLAACAPAVSSTAADEMQATEVLVEEPEVIKTGAPEEMANTQETEQMESEHSPVMTEEPVEAMADVDQPAYFSVSLINVSSGEAFKIADYQGKVILVETLAQWCSNCLKQQKQVSELHQKLGERADFVSLGLDIDPNEDSASLNDYVQRNGFDWTYAVAPAEVSREIGNLYGNQFLNPPSTPMLIIDKQGQVHPLPFGIKSVDELVEFLQPYLDES